MLTVSERNELIIKHLSFAERIASVQFKKTPRCVQWEELRSAAYMGLVDAAAKYDGIKPFEGYASFRIFGEIKDYLRSLCWCGRGQTAKVNFWDDSYDYAAETEPDDFDEFFEDVAKNLSPLGKRILKLYYADNLTLKEIGATVNFSTTRVYQILQGSLKYLRSHLDVTVN